MHSLKKTRGDDTPHEPQRVIHVHTSVSRARMCLGQSRVGTNREFVTPPCRWDSLKRQLQPKLELPRVEHGPGFTETSIRVRRDEQGVTWNRRGGKGPATLARCGRCLLLDGEARSVFVVERNDRGCAAEDG